MNQEKLPVVWTIIFNENSIYDFDPNVFTIRRLSLQKNNKESVTIISDDTTIKNNMNFRVKLYYFHDFDGRKYSWLNFQASYEAIDKAAGTEETLNKTLKNRKSAMIISRSIKIIMKKI